MLTHHPWIGASSCFNFISIFSCRKSSHIISCLLSALWLLGEQPSELCPPELSLWAKLAPFRKVGPFPTRALLFRLLWSLELKKLSEWGLLVWCLSASPLPVTPPPSLDSVGEGKVHQIICHIIELHNQKQEYTCLIKVAEEQAGFYSSDHPLLGPSNSLT